jgi:frataxin-like iron-binding protein CyaY
MIESLLLRLLANVDQLEPQHLKLEPSFSRVMMFMMKMMRRMILMRKKTMIEIWIAGKGWDYGDYRRIVQVRQKG